MLLLTFTKDDAKDVAGLAFINTAVFGGKGGLVGPVGLACI